MVITIRTTSVTPPGRSRKRVRRMSAFPPWFCNFPGALSLGFYEDFQSHGSRDEFSEGRGHRFESCRVRHRSQANQALLRLPPR